MMESEDCRKIMQFFENWEYKPLLGLLLRFEILIVGAFTERLLETEL
jgi:hypothetical protein